MFHKTQNDMWLIEFFRRILVFLGLRKRHEPAPLPAPKPKKKEDPRMKVSRAYWRKLVRDTIKANRKWNRINGHLPQRPVKRRDVERSLSDDYVISNRFGGEQVQTTKNLRKKYVRHMADRNREWNRLHPNNRFPTSPKKIRRAWMRHQRAQQNA